MLISGQNWYSLKDGDPMARALFDRHYSRYFYADGRKPKLFVGPGSKMVLMTSDGTALFVWRKFISGDGQQGVNCAIFRNEGRILSSDLILEAERLAWSRWPNERLYTYVNPKGIKSSNPGYCFIKAGWAKVGITKVNKLIILAKMPSGCLTPREPDGRQAGVQLDK
jgi:hypothetical protein